MYIKAKGLLAVKSEQFFGNTNGKIVPLGFERVANHSTFVCLEILVHELWKIVYST